MLRLTILLEDVVTYLPPKLKHDRTGGKFQVALITGAHYQLIDSPSPRQ